jgi:hypothetical protein
VGTADDLHHAIGEIAPPTLEDLSAYTARAAATANKALNLQSFPVNRGKAPLRPLIESWRYGADLAPDLEGACVILYCRQALAGFGRLWARLCNLDIA